MIGTLLSLALLALPQDQDTSPLAELKVGHVVEARGEFDESGRFVAQKLDLLAADADDVLIGTVPQDQADPEAFALLGQHVISDMDTVWENIAKGSLAGKRVKVEGSYKGPTHFRAEHIAPRGEGRDRIGARIDHWSRVEGGYEARLMNYTVFVPDGTELTHVKPIAEYGLAPERKLGGKPAGARALSRDEDDDFGEGIVLTPTLRLLGQLEWTTETDQNFDLTEAGPADEEDRWNNTAGLRLRLAWMPNERVFGTAELKYNYLYRLDEDNGVEHVRHASDGEVGETWLQLRDLGGKRGLDLTVGRQDFDDPREWLYDQNLDAVRLSWLRPDWRFDVSASTTLSDGVERDRQSWNAVAYLSNNNEDRYLSVYGLLRETDDADTQVRNASNDPVVVSLAESSLFLGARALGEWLPQNHIWAEFSFLLGNRDAPVNQGPVNVAVQNFDVATWAYDLGTTWSPPFAEPLYFTAGYALGKGASNPAESYRQTGYEDNTARFGGVTTFQYYGELIDPELSNLGISTLGVGARVAERTSVDLVYHTYTQDRASPIFSPVPEVQANINRNPNGIDADLGWELDLVFGFRRFKAWDLEIIGATFDPGPGFDQNDTAYYGKVQLRFRL